MSAVTTESGVPLQFEAGTTVRFTDGDPDYSAVAWVMDFVMNNGADAPTVIRATTSNVTGFEVVIPASTTLKPGRYTWAEYFTAISPTTEKARGKSGLLDVLPNLSETTTPSFAQSMVTLLEEANRTGAASRRSSISFNGQSVSWNSPAEFKDQWLFWKSLALAEQRKAANLRGDGDDGRIRIQFEGAGYWPRYYR